MTGGCGVYELRQYTLKPGMRDTLIDLFDRELVEPQDAVGMRVLGQFRDLDRPDKFVWLRCFTDMDTRAKALEAFYYGPVWRAHGDAANATMLGSDDVLLLRPSLGGRTVVHAVSRPSVDSPEPSSVVTATVFSFAEPPRPDLVRAAAVCATDSADDPLGTGLLESEHQVNTFPALPVREGEHVLVRVERFEDDDVRAARRERAERDEGCARARALLAPHLLAPPRELRLRPTRRSLLR